MKIVAKKAVGRPRIHLKERKRHNLNIERDEAFDLNISTVQKVLAKQYDRTVTKTEAVKEALDRFAKHLLIEGEKNQCPRCNGIGYIWVMKGDDDQPCPECERLSTDTPY